MKQLKLSDFLKFPISPFLLGAFLSRTMQEQIDEDKYFYAYTSFKKSKAAYYVKFSTDPIVTNYIDYLNDYSLYPNWILKNITDSNYEARFYVLNDLNLSMIDFYNSLYSIVFKSDWTIDDNFNDNKRDFIRGFFELRGSVDTSAKFLSQDYFYSNKRELKKALILTDMMGIPQQYMNFNARDLQPDFVSGKNRRNTQFRMHLFYYAKNIGFINHYKAEIFKNSYNYLSSSIIKNVIYFDIELPNPKIKEANFINRINFFTDYIYKNELTPELIKTLRKESGIDRGQQNNVKSNRNSELVELCQNLKPDKCAACGTTSTFLNKKTNKQYFEIHHVIPFSNGAMFDNFGNLVKLCPTCHDSLKRGRAPKDKQIENIIKILHNAPEVYEFTSNALGIENIIDLANEIWKRLA